MREGMYGLVILADAGEANGSLVLESGRIFGVDGAGAFYDGAYTAHDDGRTDVRIKVTMPAQVTSVLGTASPEPWSISLEATGNFAADEGEILLGTEAGPTVTVRAAYKFLRPITPTA